MAKDVSRARSKVKFKNVQITFKSKPLKFKKNQHKMFDSIIECLCKYLEIKFSFLLNSPM